jgi:hypothetical protein
MPRIREIVQITIIRLAGALGTKGIKIKTVTIPVNATTQRVKLFRILANPVDVALAVWMLGVITKLSKTDNGSILSLIYVVLKFRKKIHRCQKRFSAAIPNELKLFINLLLWRIQTIRAIKILGLAKCITLLFLESFLIIDPLIR